MTLPPAVAAEASLTTLEHGLDAARAARAAGDLPTALGIYSDLRARFPDHAAPYREAAAALLDLFHFDEADVLLDVAMERFPADAGVAIDRAWVAHRRRDGAEAARRWEQVRRDHPEQLTGYTGAVATLRQAGQLDAAEALLAQARARFPDDPGPLVEGAWNAMARHDLDSALDQWRAVRDRAPGLWLGYSGGATALRQAGRLLEAEELLTVAMARFPDEPGLLTEFAWVAAARSDWAAAARRWEDLGSRFPDRVDACLGQARALREMRAFDAADALLEAAMVRLPGNPHLAAEHAWVAHIRADWPQAAERWARIRAQFPDQPTAFVQGIAALRESGQSEEAEELATLARQRFPDSLETWLVAARTARDRGQIEAAEAAFRQAVARFPDRIEPWAELAWLLTHARRFDDALRIWQDMRDRFPGLALGHVGGAVALRDSNRLTEADAMLTAALSRFPEDFNVRVERGWLALTQGNPTEAASRFAGLRDRYPEQPLPPLGLGRALVAMGRFEEAEAVYRAGSAAFPAFDLLARDLEDLPRLRSAEPVPEPASLPRPSINRDGPVRVAVTGYHLSHQLSVILTRLPPFRGKLEVEWINPGVGLDGLRARLPDDWLAGVDAYFEEIVGDAETKRGLRSLLPPNCDIASFPSPHMRALWPFHGRDARLVPEPPLYNGGRYTEPDAVAAAIADPTMTDDALFDAYMAETDAMPLDLDALNATDRARWEQEERGCRVKIADFIQTRFRSDTVFAAPYERGTPLVTEIARQLLATPVLRDICDLDTALAGLAQLTIGWQAADRALPVHPRVARHFGLSWWAPDMAYRIGHNMFTFREYTIRYLRWSPWLA